MARMRGVVALGLAALLCVGLRIPSVEAATSVTFQAASTSDTSTADNMLDQGTATRNNGVCTTNTTDATSGGANRILVQFNNISTIPSDAAIKTATLSLFQTANGGSRTLNAHRITSSWGEGNKCNATCATSGATWNQRNVSTCTGAWTTAGGDFNSTATSSITVGTTNSVFYDWAIAADVQAYVLGTAVNNGTLIKDSAENAKVTHTFAMKENTTAANRPKLVVTYLRQVTGLTASARSGQVDLNWTLPSPSGDYNGVLIVRKSGSDFTSNSSTNPTDGFAYVATNTIGDGTVISNNTTSATSFTDTGCSNGTTCYYRIFARDSSTNYSASTTSGADPTYPKINATPPDGVTQTYNWNYATGATTLAPPGLTPNGVVVSGSNDSKLHGMSASNGARSFTPFATGNAIQSRPPVIPSSLVTSLPGVTPAFVTSQDGFTYAVNTATGAQVWKSASLGTALQGGAAVWLQAILATTFTGGVTDDVVFVTTRNTGDTTTNKVYGLNVATGATVWTFNPGNMDGIASTPYIDYFSATVWVSSLSKSGTQASLWKLNALTGALVTSFSFGDITSSPVGSLDGRVNRAPSFIYVGTDAGTLKAIKVSDNTVTTHTPTGGSGAVQGFPLSFSFSTPSASTPDTIVFSRTATVHSVSFNGSSFSENWTTTNFPSASVSSVSAPIDNSAGTKVYVGASDGAVHRLRLSDGVDEARVSTLSTQTVGAPSFDVDLGRTYTGAADGRIYSFTSP